MTDTREPKNSHVVLSLFDAQILIDQQLSVLLSSRLRHQAGCRQLPQQFLPDHNLQGKR
jgi:hypothetical protein